MYGFGQGIYVYMYGYIDTGCRRRKLDRKLQLDKSINHSKNIRICLSDSTAYVASSMCIKAINHFVVQAS